MQGIAHDLGERVGSRPGPEWNMHQFVDSYRWFKCSGASTTMVTKNKDDGDYFGFVCSHETSRLEFGGRLY